MSCRILAALTVGFLSVAAHASPPVADITASSVPGLSFEQYTGTTIVGTGAVNTDVLYYIDEKTGPLGKSWYIFYEPVLSEALTATFTFDGPVTAIYTTEAQLDGSNATYGASGITYGTSTLIGLEARSDTISFSGDVVTMSWLSKNPGDHIRVFVASSVPEPSTTAMMAAGLLAMGYAARRRADRS